MRRIRLILTGIFLAGVLFGGIGAGIAFLEYSSFQFEGVKQLGEAHMVTENLDFPVEEEKGIVIAESSYYDRDYKLETDESVPAGVVRYQVTYNEMLVKPYFRFYEEDKADLPPEDNEAAESSGPEPVYAGVLQLAFQHTGDDFIVIMEEKDKILNDLQQKKLSDYQIVPVTEVRILVNPETLEYVERKDWTW